MGRYSDYAWGSGDFRYVLHMGFWENDIDWYFGGSCDFVFETDDAALAFRTYASICLYMNQPFHDTFLGMYLHERKMQRHPNLRDEGHGLTMRWYLEDNESGWFNCFDVPIYEKPDPKE